MDDQQSTGLGGQVGVVCTEKSDYLVAKAKHTIYALLSTISLVHHQNSDIISTSNSDLGIALKSEDILHEFILQLISVTLPPTSSAQWSLKHYEGSKYSIGHKDDQQKAAITRSPLVFVYLHRTNTKPSKKAISISHFPTRRGLKTHITAWNSFEKTLISPSGCGAKKKEHARHSSGRKCGGVKASFGGGSIEGGARSAKAYRNSLIPRKALPSRTYGHPMPPPLATMRSIQVDGTKYEASSANNEVFRFCHCDLSCTNIFVDPISFKAVGIIDWEVMEITSLPLRYRTVDFSPTVHGIPY
ncbi:uncharacterized protein RSE6_10848 [Rhynchosporium secalis]|uniref:Aminoglycoside phosphotransferase domain-containing protein n=1 Tax=Rhynchosporium secalis TaxID=38038 RepID=A0A1E1MLG6_RHYSE|nr:uncharacterized protein RSE6_10848 [Rhynchosporium secalis]